jgi:Effector-associated domain 11/CHAT domain
MKKINIQFVTTNPQNLRMIQTSSEFKNCKNALLLGKKRDDFEFLPEFSGSTLGELMRIPTEVHFIHIASHGTEDGIYMADHENNGKLIPNEAIDLLFESKAGKTKLVLLSSCFSVNQAEIISKHGICVIGYARSVPDKAAATFSEGFYLGLGEGKSIKESYNDGMISLMTQDSESVGLLEIWMDGAKISKEALEEIIWMDSFSKNTQEIQPIFEKIQTEIAKGNLKKAIDILVKETENDEDLHNQAIQLSSRYHTNERKNSMGILDYNQYNIELSKISYAVVSLGQKK